MNHFYGNFRLTKDPEITMSQSGSKIAKYSGATTRRQNGENVSDFFNFTAFGAGAEFAEKFLVKGSRIFLTGHIQTGQYTNREGVKVYTTDYIVENHEFVDKKAETEALRAARSNEQAPATPAADANADFIKVPEGADSSVGLPFD